MIQINPVLGLSTQQASQISLTSDAVCFVILFGFYARNSVDIF